MLGVKDEDLEVDESFFLYELRSSDVTSLEKLIPQPSWRGAQKQCITLLGEAMPSLLKQLKRAAESVFKASLRSEEI